MKNLIFKFDNIMYLKFKFKLLLKMYIMYYLINCLKYNKTKNLVYIFVIIIGEVAAILSSNKITDLVKI